MSLLLLTLCSVGCAAPEEDRTEPRSVELSPGATRTVVMGAIGAGVDVLNRGESEVLVTTETLIITGDEVRLGPGEAWATDTIGPTEFTLLNTGTRPTRVAMTLLDGNLVHGQFRWIDTRLSR